MATSKNMPLTGFLQSVAADLVRRFGHDMHEVCVVCPGKRVRLFLENALVEAAGGVPLWAPQFLTISELFARLAPQWTLMDKAESICRLYPIYKKYMASSETLDAFYGFGEHLLTDFNDVDKCLKDARQIFNNALDLSELTSTEHLTERQRRVLEEFFNTTTLSGTQLRERFIALWRALIAIYDEYKATLRAESLAYDGMMMRDVAEHAEERLLRLKAEGLGIKYVFLGFNILTAAEKKLLRAFQQQKRDETNGVLFYWDYDEYFLKQNPDCEAGTYLRENLLLFPSALPTAAPVFHQFAEPKKIHIIGAPTESAAANFLSSALTEVDNATSSAVVLCREGGIEHVLHALPEAIQDVNITKGFPLAHTQLYARLCSRLKTEGLGLTVENLLQRLQNFIEKETDALINEELGVRSEECLSAGKRSIELHSVHSSPLTPHSSLNIEEAVILEREALLLVARRVERLRMLRETPQNAADATPLLDVTPTTFVKLLRQMLETETIPMAGEPAVGLQLIGMLETRCLDFDRLFILSANEGDLPQKPSYGSILPYFLRKAYGLTMPEERVAVYAYNFYRLIARAHDIYILYTASTEKGKRGELSRFVQQLEVEDENPQHLIERLTLQTETHTEQMSVRENGMKKPADFLERSLKAPFLPSLPPEVKPLKALSPSSLNQYVVCPLEFYYYHVEGLRERPKLETETAPNFMGSVIHKAAELFYERLIALQPMQWVKKTDYLPYTQEEKRQERIDTLIEEAYQVVLQEEKEHDAEKAALTEHCFDDVARMMAGMFLENLLRYDASVPKLIPLACEVEISVPIAFTDAEGRRVEKQMHGFIDRLDLIETADGVKHLRIVDYKTGNCTQKNMARDMEQVFERSAEQKYYILQTMTYCYMLHKILQEPASDSYAALQKQLPQGYALTHADYNVLSPHLFFLPDLAKALRGGGNYDTGIYIKKERVEDFESLLPEFEEPLLSTLQSLYDLSIPFEASCIPKHCEHCAFQELCK